MQKYTYLVVLFLLGLFSCASDAVPHSVMSPEELEPVIWDLMAAGEVKMSDTARATQLHLKDSATAAFQSVLQIHHLDKQTFLKSYIYYENHPAAQAVLIDSLIAYNERKTKILNTLPADSKGKKALPK